MLQMVKKRLEQLGYEVSEGDLPSLCFLIDKTDNFIMEYCNIGEVPCEVTQAEIDLICAEHLKAMSMCGKLDETFELKKVASITEGDTSVSYANGGDTGQMTVTSFYKEADERLKLVIQPYRCMRW